VHGPREAGRQARVGLQGRVHLSITAVS
jgi:hypothetical protein